MTAPDPAHMSSLVERLYARLPEVYRTQDATQAGDRPLYRYLGAVLAQAGRIDDTIDGMIGARPVGPDAPEPWALQSEELAVWREARTARLSSLGDPWAAPVAWLPWMAQLVGARLDPTASEAEQRDTIGYATSGWRAGTRGAIVDAAKTALTGSRYARVVPHRTPTEVGGLQPGRVWDVTVVTRKAETPDPGAVLGAIDRKGAKPAGVVLHHSAYTASWDQIEAVYPTWTDWEVTAGSFARLEEAGLTYQQVPNNLLSNSSFEVDTVGWTERTGTFGRVLGGLDGVGMLRITATVDGPVAAFHDPVPVTELRTYALAASMRPQIATTARVTGEWLDGAGAVVSSFSSDLGGQQAGAWARHTSSATAPAGSTQLRTVVEADGLANTNYLDVDAVLAREGTS